MSEKTEPCIDCGERLHPDADDYERTEKGRRCFPCVLVYYRARVEELEAERDRNAAGWDNVTEISAKREIRISELVEERDVLTADRDRLAAVVEGVREWCDLNMGEYPECMGIEALFAIFGLNPWPDMPLKAKTMKPEGDCPKCRAIWYASHGHDDKCSKHAATPAPAKCEKDDWRCEGCGVELYEDSDHDTNASTVTTRCPAPPMEGTMSDRKIENEMNLTAAELRREYADVLRALSETAKERDEAIARADRLAAVVTATHDWLHTERGKSSRIDAALVALESLATPAPAKCETCERVRKWFDNTPAIAWAHPIPMNELRAILDGAAADDWDGEHCQRCGRGYPTVWIAPDAVWERVTGRTDGGGLFCVNCFDAMAQKAGLVLSWTCAEMGD